jgi:hypothetical protein
MKRLSLFLVCLVAVSLACSIQVGGSFHSDQPTSTPTATKFIHPKPTATNQVADALAVTISQAVVKVRKSAGGEETGNYVRSGERVQIVRCVDDWCQIQKPSGWIFRGCIAELADGLLCQAKP